MLILALTAIMSILLKGVKKMQLGIRYNDDVHNKLKVIAAYKRVSLNALIRKMFDREIAEWEQAHGVIEIPVNE